MTAAYAREVIHAFNARGSPRWTRMERGPTTKFGPQARRVRSLASPRPRPQQLDLPFTTWSLSKLVAHLGSHERIMVSTETVRQVLRGAGISWQATKTWKGSKDPEFATKLARLLWLYDAAAEDACQTAAG